MRGSRNFFEKIKKKVWGGGGARDDCFARGKGTKAYCFIKLLCKFNKLKFSGDPANPIPDHLHLRSAHGFG